MKETEKERTFIWHMMDCDSIFSRLNTSPAGLSRGEAAERLAELGYNELESSDKISPWQILADSSGMY
jgi:magnesium-transporting ATPase (P-type)